ncbi:MAG: ligase-associated DNA damage response endonuclease PdeM [Hyphomonadaceae bacterium]|jgi:DNA ligase-associated metallophosphoesterase|nr:ligase-associated DNA damage response endonuclease PdeM [Hyphomonadaceae bacterium]
MLGLKPERFHLVLETVSQPVALCGKQLIADNSGALYWPGEGTLLVADLHLEKGSAFAERGTLLPPYDTRQTLMRLAEVIDRYEPARVIALGDSVHDVSAARRMATEDLQILRIMQEDREWIWLTGNHDPQIAPSLGGRALGELCIGGIALRHQPMPGCATHEIAGHLHPAARLSMYGYSIRRPCFVGNSRRLIMPAFGTFAGGLNVLDEAFEPLFGRDGIAVWMLGQEGLYPVATRFLCGD